MANPEEFDAFITKFCQETPWGALYYENLMGITDLEWEVLLRDAGYSSIEQTVKDDFAFWYQELRMG